MKSTEIQQKISKDIERCVNEKLFQFFKELDVKNYIVQRNKFDVKIIDIGLSLRTVNCLNQYNLKTIGDILVHEVSELMSMESFGRKSLMELEDYVSKLELCFGMDLLIYGYIKSLK